jgi:hypothetical protein
MLSTRARTIAFVALAFSFGRPALAQDAHVRPLTPMARDAVTRGIEQSSSFRALVERLNGSNVVVYVQDERALPPALAARLTFMTTAGGSRFVMVQLSRRLPPSRQVAALGHELQHAVEIAERPWIVDDRSLAGEYASLAIARPPERATMQFFETARALATTQRILREVMR